MSLKFNPFTGTFDFTVSAAVEEKAKGVPEGGAEHAVLAKKSATSYEDEWTLIANANVSATAAIAFSKLDPELIIKTTSQTITGLKTFESITPAEGVGGLSGAEAIKFSIANGNVNTDEKPIPAPGEGGKFKLTTGAGGKTTKATVTNSGGKGGQLALTTGAGGSATAEGTVKAIGASAGPLKLEAGEGGEVGGSGTGTAESGGGGEYKMSAGNGGNNSSTTSGTKKGGTGGQFACQSGKGGAIESGAGQAGEAGALKFEAGSGGPALGVGGKGGKGGLVRFTSGQGGAGGETNGAGGAIQFVIAGGASESETGAGALQVYFAKPEIAEKLRLELTAAGFLKLQKSIGLWEHAPPAAKPAEIKPEEITVKALMEKLNTLHKEYGITS